MGLFDKVFKKKFEDGKRTVNRNSAEYKSNIKLATAALLVLMAHADDDFTEDEHKKIIYLLRKRFGISEEEVESLIVECRGQIIPETQVRETLKFIDDNFYFDEKYDLMKYLYSLMLADSDLNTHEVKLFSTISSALGINKIALETIKKDVEREN
ncbi:hypothetical protein MASR1M107_12540 [Ignavibacteriales bacterium]